VKVRPAERFAAPSGKALIGRLPRRPAQRQLRERDFDARVVEGELQSAEDLAPHGPLLQRRHFETRPESKITAMRKLAMAITSRPCYTSVVLILQAASAFHCDVYTPCS